MLERLPYDLREYTFELYLDGLRARMHERDDFVTRLIGALCQDKQEREPLRRWLADAVAGRQPGVALALVGREECGKRILVTLLSRLAPTMLTRDLRANASVIVHEGPVVRPRRLKRMAAQHRIVLLLDEPLHIQPLLTIYCTETCMGAFAQPLLTTCLDAARRTLTASE